MIQRIRAVTGSRAYGLHKPESDYDSAIVFSSDPSEFYGMDAIKERTQEISPDGSDVNYWSIRKFIEGLYSGNHLAYELLRSPKVEADEIGKEIMDFGKKHLYSESLAKKMLSFHKAMKHGWIKGRDLKQLSHALRVQCYFASFFDKGSFKTKLSPEQRSYLENMHYMTDDEKETLLETEAIETRLSRFQEAGVLKTPEYGVYNDFLVYIHKKIYT